MFENDFIDKLISNSFTTSNIQKINLLGELLKTNDSLIIAAREHQGKTTLAYSLILSLIADGYQWADTKHSNTLNLNNDLTAPLKTFIYDTENHKADLKDMIGTKSDILENNKNVVSFFLKDHWETIEYEEEVKKGKSINYESFEAVSDMLNKTENKLGFKFDQVLIDTASNLLPSDIKEQESIRKKYISMIQAGRALIMIWQFTKDNEKELFKGSHTLKTSIHNQWENKFNTETSTGTLTVLKSKRNGLTGTEIEYKLNDNYNSKNIVDIVDIKLSVQNSQQKPKLVELIKKIQSKFKNKNEFLPNDLMNAIMELTPCKIDNAKKLMRDLKSCCLIRQDKKGDPCILA